MAETKITTYTAINDTLQKGSDCYEGVFMSVVHCVGDTHRAENILEACTKGDKRLIFYYPPCQIDMSGWELLGAIDDGALYLG